MGLLNFFSKSKVKREGFEFPSRDELDIPPAPPSITEEPAEFPDFMGDNEISPVGEAEEEAVRIVEDDLEERESLELTKPIFIKYGMYKAMLDELGQVKVVLKESEDTLNRLTEFEEEKDKEYLKWRRELDDIQKKLIYADKILFSK